MCYVHDHRLFTNTKTDLMPTEAVLYRFLKLKAD